MIGDLNEIVTQAIEVYALRSGRPPEMIVILLFVAHFVPDECSLRAALQKDSVYEG